MADVPEIEFVDENPDGTVAIVEAVTPVDVTKKFPPAIMVGISQEKIDEFKGWVEEWLYELIASQQSKQDEWKRAEIGYRGLPGPKMDKPYIGACNDTVPAIAMAVDPIHARLDTGIFKQRPAFTLKGLKKSFVEYTPALEAWIDYYQKHKLKLRRVASPRILENVKLGTMVFRTEYDRQQSKIKTYDKSNSWKVVEKEHVSFSGPRVFGVSLGDFLFPPTYQHLQDCPIVAERIRTTWYKLKAAEAAGKLTNVDSLKGQETVRRTVLEDVRDDMSNHESAMRYKDDIIVYRVWCDYDINGDGLAEKLVATFELNTRELLELRFNWYFNQKYPYTLIPYMVTNDSLYGLGLCEMVLPFQEALTKWHRMATDNAYLANIRMYIVKKESGIETVPRLYAGRCFFVDDPKSDFIPFASGDIYPSTLAERQNIFGLVEKRTGVSDYLTGRESPIIGSRATATSTLALIQEGTKRVEEVLENYREGFAEIITNCIYIWIQYGLEGLDDLVFGDDEIGVKVKEFFESVSAENVDGAIAVDLTATDATGSRQVMQQMQLQIINIMMQYLEKLLAAGQGALQAQATMPELTEMIKDVMGAARRMFRDLLTKYDIRNPDDYLPDLEKYLNGPTAVPDVAGTTGQSVQPAIGAGLPVGLATLARPGVPRPAVAGGGTTVSNGSPAPGGY